MCCVGPRAWPVEGRKVAPAGAALSPAVGVSRVSVTLPAVSNAAAEGGAGGAARCEEHAGVQPWAAWCAWAADELGLLLKTDGPAYLLEEPPREDDPDPTPPLRRSWFRRRGSALTDESSLAPPLVTKSSRELVDELMRRLRERGRVTHARPVHQPEAVHDLSARLFDAYKLDGGRAHLAGFHLDDVPLALLVTVQGEESPDLAMRYYDELGAPVPWRQAEALGVDRLAPIGEAAPRLDDARRDRMLESAYHAARDSGVAPIDLAVVVWAKRAWGRVRFDFGGQSIDAEFDGWARTLQPPKVVCPLTGVATYHLATVHGGKIAAADQIAVCAVTGHRRVRADLAPCAATGRLAEPDALVECPVTLQRVLPAKIERCRLCEQRVSTPACPDSVCRACREKTRVGVDDERIVRLIAAHPGLSRMSRWRLSLTRDVLIVEATRRLQNVLLVFNRETLEPIRAMASLRVAGSWRPLSPEQQQRLLR